MFSLKYPQFNLGFSWIICLRCGYKYNTTISIRMGRFSEVCPKTCPVNLLSIGFLNAMFLHILDEMCD